MAEVKISELDPFVGTLDGDELFEMSKEDSVWESWSFKLSDFETHFSGSFVAKSGDTMTGQLKIFDAADVAVGPITGPAILMHGTSGANSGFSGIRWDNSAGGFQAAVASSRSGVPGAYDALTTNDQLGTVTFAGDTGSEILTGVSLRAHTLENWSGSARGSIFMIYIVPAGGTGQNEILRLTHGSGLSMFGANPVIDQDRLHRLRSYTVGTLPTPGTAGRMAWASDCRVFNGTGTQEGAGSGTGGLVTDNGANWVIAGTNVTAVA